jgi:hypothetical protein
MADQTDLQLYLAIGVPSALFALNFGAILAAAFWQAKRFDDMKDLFQSEIGRAEGVLSAKIDGRSEHVKAPEYEKRSPLVKR